MKAYVLTDQGPLVTQCDEPAISPNELLIDVRACGLNRVDLMMARGHVHGKAGGVGAVLGVECAGEVTEVGSAVHGWLVGDRVMCSGAGCFAQRVRVDAGRVLPMPENMSFTQAAALPVALQTMHDALLTTGGLVAGETVLVQGASSGVGLMALQIAKWRGARWVAGSSMDTGRRQRLGEFGADLAFDSQDPQWVKQVLAATEGHGVDLLIDQVAGELFVQNMQATKIGGRIVNVGRLGGMRAEFDFDLHALRRITYSGVTFRTRSRAQLRAVTQRTHADLWPALTAGQLLLPVDKVFEFDAVAAALDHMRTNRHFGKIILAL